jgi:glutamyl-tRNA reductase
LEVEVGEEIESHAEAIVEEAIKDLKKKLKMVAVSQIRNSVNRMLPRMYSQLLKDIEKGNELNLSRLYNKQEIIENIKSELKRF